MFGFSFIFQLPWALAMTIIRAKAQSTCPFDTALKGGVANQILELTGMVGYEPQQRKIDLI